MVVVVTCTVVVSADVLRIVWEHLNCYHCKCWERLREYRRLWLHTHTNYFAMICRRDENPNLSSLRVNWTQSNRLEKRRCVFSVFWTLQIRISSCWVYDVKTNWNPPCPRTRLRKRKKESQLTKLKGSKRLWCEKLSERRNEKLKIVKKKMWGIKRIYAPGSGYYYLFAISPHSHMTRRERGIEKRCAYLSVAVF